jgi:hypothetical protein
MKGNTSVCRTSRFRIIVSRTTTSMSPFSMKCEMHLYYERLPYEEMGDAHNRGAFALGPHALKFQALRSPLSHLAIF